MDKTKGERLFFALRTLAIGAFLIYVFQLIYRDFLPCDGKDLRGFTLWLSFFVFLSGCARNVLYPFNPFRYSSMILFFVIITVISLPLPFGSLYVRIGLLFLPLLSVPSAEMRQAGADLFMWVTSLMLYLYFSILAYDESGNKTFFQKLRRIIAFLKENKGYFLLLVVGVLTALELCCFIQRVAFDVPNMKRLSRINVTNSGNVYEGRVLSLTVEGTFPNNRRYLISHSIFGTQYMVSDPSVAGVTKNGKVFGLKPGNVKIRVKNRNYETTINITIKQWELEDASTATVLERLERYHIADQPGSKHFISGAWIYVVLLIFTGIALKSVDPFIDEQEKEELPQMNDND